MIIKEPVAVDKIGDENRGLPVFHGSCKIRQQRDQYANKGT